MGLIAPFDFRNLNWNKVQSASSPGMLAKANINLNNKLYFLKLGSYNIAYGFYGNEPLFELLNSRVGLLLDLPVLKYDFRDYYWWFINRRVQDAKNCKIPFITWR